MGKLRNMGSAQVSGNAGAWNFRQRAGEIVQAARSYTNSSKGNGASYAQRAHRVRLGNLVNMYKAVGTVLKGAFETKPAGLSDFNMFVKKNLSTNGVFLTKQNCVDGLFVPFNYQVSEGTLPTPNMVVAMQEEEISSVVTFKGDFSALTSSGNQTVGKFTTAFLAANPSYKEGDNVNLIQIACPKDYNSGRPAPFVKHIEILLDTVSSTTLASLFGSAASISASADGLVITFERPTGAYSWVTGGSAPTVVIMTRGKGAAMKVSTAYMSISEMVAEELHDEFPLVRAMESYGYQSSPLMAADKDVFGY